MTTNGTTMEEVRTMEAIQDMNRKMSEMDLRDLFAMHALNGLIAAKALASYDEVARIAWSYADAMMKTRNE